MSETAYLTSVRAQYEDLPYPFRNPEDERTRLLSPITAGIDRICHWGFGGVRDLRTGCRVLIAGGGTGDTTIFLAEQLRNHKAEIVYVDFSQASYDIAKKRAEIRGLTNIHFVHGSLLDLPKMGLGLFDFIDCSGVLHHLASPDDGIKALAAVLKEDGVLSTMVYGQYGRAGIYQVQQLTRLLTTAEDTRERKLAYTHHIVQSLTPEHILNKGRFTAEKVARTDDTEVYDLFLHSQDRAYTIPEFYDFIECAGLKIGTLFASHELQGNHLYRPESYIRDPELLARVKNLDLRTQHTIGELLHGAIIKHSCYASRNPVKPPSPDDVNLVPFLCNYYGEKGYAFIREEAKRTLTGSDVVIGEKENQRCVAFPKQPWTETLLELIDGRKMIGAILKLAQAKHPNAAPDAIRRNFNDIYNAMNLHNWMLLRAATIPEFMSVPEMQARAF